MKPTTLTAPVALFLLAAAAHGAVQTGDQLGTTEADIRAALEGAGYTVDEIEVEGNEIEADVQLNGTSYEVEISDSGEVLSVFSEGSDGDQDEHDEDERDDDDAEDEGERDDDDGEDGDDDDGEDDDGDDDEDNDDND